MTEMVINSETLPKPLLQFIRAKKVKVEVNGGEIRLTPFSDGDMECPLLGLLDGFDEYTTEKFLERKHTDKELEL